MTILRINTLLLAGCASLIAVGAATAGGFDRGGVGVDLLFDPAKVATEAGVTYVSPQRTLNNVQRQDSPPYPQALYSSSVEVEGDYTVPRFGIKMNLFEPVDCLGTYTEPYGVYAKYGTDNAYSPSAVELDVGTKDYGLTCSYKFDLGKGSARIIGGVSYQEVDAFLSRQTLLSFGNTGIGNFQLGDNAWSWRIGAAYEIPEMALRASLMYSAAYKYDLTGTVDSTGFGPVVGTTPPFDQYPTHVGIDPVTASAQIPQAVELKVQSGIAPGWVAFGSVKWQQWSKVKTIPIQGVISPVYGTPTPVSFDPLYQDGWTVTGGVGHKFNEQLSGLVAVTWDRGTSTISGYQTDSWNFSAGGSWTPTQNIELRLGGSVGVLTAGTSSFDPDGPDRANAVTYSFGDDMVYSGTASLRVKF